MRLAPDPDVSPERLEAGQRALVRDAAWASLCGALCGGVILVAFALSLEASPLHIGLLAAIPFLAQAVQLPAIQFVERLRQRRKIVVLAGGASRLSILGFALVPIAPPEHRLALLIAIQCAISAFGSVSACAFNAWLHQLIPRESLGAFFSRRLFWSTLVACAATLAAGLLVDQAPPELRAQAFSLAFVCSVLAGALSSRELVRTPEPPMHDAGPAASLRSRLAVPLADRNFRRVLVFLGAWNVASNLAAPFLAVYLIRQLGYPLATVTALWVTSQLANALTLYLWGRLSDRLSNKAVLAVALPAYFACTLGLVFARGFDGPGVQLALLFALHVTMGAASGGIGLAAGNLGLKLAPRGQATPYLAAIGLVAAIGGGLAPLAAGAIAQQLRDNAFSVVVRWSAPGSTTEASVLSFAHWEFVFALSALVGLYVMHALSRIREGDEISERVVMQEFALEAVRTLNQLSTIGGALGSLFTFERFAERRRVWPPHKREGGA